MLENCLININVRNGISLGNYTVEVVRFDAIEIFIMLHTICYVIGEHLSRAWVYIRDCL